MTGKIEVVKSYKTPDGQVFEDVDEAQTHMQHLAVGDKIHDWVSSTFAGETSGYGETDIVEAIDNDWEGLYEIFEERRLLLATPVDLTQAELHQALDTRMDIFGLHGRTQNALDGAGLIHAGDVLLLGESQLTKTKGLGSKGVEEIKLCLRTLNVTLATDTLGWVAPGERLSKEDLDMVIGLALMMSSQSPTNPTMGYEAIARIDDAVRQQFGIEAFDREGFLAHYQGRRDATQDEDEDVDVPASLASPPTSEEEEGGEKEEVAPLILPNVDLGSLDDIGQAQPPH